MKNVIVVNYTGRNGGGPIDAIEMAKGFAYNGISVVAIISKKVSNLDDWISFGFEKVILIDTFVNIKDMIKKELLFNKCVLRVLKDELVDYKVRFVYCPMVSPWTRKINRFFENVPIYVVNHDPLPHSGDTGTKILNFFGMQKVYKKSEMIVTHSEIFIEYIEKRYDKKNRVLYVPLGPQSVRNTGVQKINYDPKKINFLFFGRVEDYKGIDILCLAYAKMKDRYNNISLSIVGNGDFSKYATIVECLDDVTIVNEWIPDDMVGDYFLGENIVLVLPYKDATQSGPILIGYQYHVPVIATNVGGLGAQVIEGKTGFLIEPGNVNSLCEAMQKFVENPKLISATKQGIDIYMDEISWTSSAKKILKWKD